MNFNRALIEYLDPVERMKRLYPKAARKRRIIKKWENRFPNYRDRIAETSAPSIFERLLQKPAWQAGTVTIPIQIGGRV